MLASALAMSLARARQHQDAHAASQIGMDIERVDNGRHGCCSPSASSSTIVALLLLPPFPSVAIDPLGMTPGTALKSASKSIPTDRERFVPCCRRSLSLVLNPSSIHTYECGPSSGFTSKCPALRSLTESHTQHSTKSLLGGSAASSVALETSSSASSKRRNLCGGDSGGRMSSRA